MPVCPDWRWAAAAAAQSIAKIYELTKGLLAVSFVLFLVHYIVSMAFVAFGTWVPDP